MTRIAVLFRRFGPYHHARLNAAGELNEIVGVEESSADEVYEWDIVQGASSFRKITVFEDKDPVRQPFQLLRQRIRAAMMEAAPDVIATNGYSSRGTLAALEYAMQAGIPAITMSDSAEHDFRRNRLREAIKRRIVRMFSAGLVAGQLSFRYLETLGMSSGRIFTALDVVDNDHFEAGAMAARRDAVETRRRFDLPERYFLTCTRFIPKKNLPMLLEAYARYRKSAGTEAWGLVLLGSGVLIEEVNEVRRELDIEEAVLMPGFKQYDELPIFYSHAGAFILPSVSEQWGLVVNEAMAAGIPVLVSDRCGCVPDLVEEGGNGFTFDPYDIDALVGHMLRIAGGECDLTAMGQASQEIISRWSPRAFAVGLDKAARSSLAAPRRKPSMLARAALKWAMRRSGKAALTG